MRNILFVDDEPAILDALKRRLSSGMPDWTLHFADCPRAALDLIADQPIQVLVSDLAMPHLNGLELARSVKKTSPSTQVLLLTGHADLDTALAAINEADIFRFYRKPFDSKQLVVGISDAFDEYERVTAANEPMAGDGFGQAALKRLSLGIIVVETSAKVVFMNPRGTEITTEQDGLTIDPAGILRSDRPAETERLHAAIDSVLEDANPDAVEALGLARPSMLRPYSVLVSGLPGDGEQRTGQAVLFVTDPEQTPEISPQAVGRLFHLTEQEARLATALAQGASVAEAAEELGVTTETARTYLKQIFSKTGTGRQAELVRLVVTAPTVTLSNQTQT